MREKGILKGLKGVNVLNIVTLCSKGMFTTSHVEGNRQESFIKSMCLNAYSIHLIYFLFYFKLQFNYIFQHQQIQRIYCLVFVVKGLKGKKHP